MSAQNIEARTARVIAETGGLEVADVKQESTLAQLGLDSLDEVEIQIDLEDEFGITLPDSLDAMTVSEICAAVRVQVEVLA